MGKVVQIVIQRILIAKIKTCKDYSMFLSETYTVKKWQSIFAQEWAISLTNEEGSLKFLKKKILSFFEGKKGKPEKNRIPFENRFSKNLDIIRKIFCRNWHFFSVLKLNKRFLIKIKKFCYFFSFLLNFRSQIPCLAKKSLNMFSGTCLS